MVALGGSNRHRAILAAAYSHTTHGENVTSLIAKLEFCGVILGWFDKFLSSQLIKYRPLVRLQIRTRILQ